MMRKIEKITGRPVESVPVDFHSEKTSCEGDEKYA
jgi:hypothetical protein